MESDPDTVQQTIARLAEGRPRFPDGRIDYRGAKAAAVVTIFLLCDGEILLLKRSDRVGTHQGKWSAITGYVDRIEPLSHRVAEELREEIGLDAATLTEVAYGRPFSFEDDGRTWHVFPVLARIERRPPIALDWEHTGCVWIPPGDLPRYDTVPQLDRSLREALAAGSRA